LRKPKNIDYLLDEHGINIGVKSFGYDKFRSFTAVQEGDFVNITLIPLKRFSPATGMCYGGAEVDKVLRILSNRLPIEEHHADFLDGLMQRIRF